MSAMDSAVASSNEFGLKLLRTCRNLKPEGNLFYSPVSISACLSMLRTGAKEDTLKQIEEILSNGESNCREEGFGFLSTYLQELRGPITLKTSNILVVDKQFVVRPEFVDHLKLNYNSEMKELPFQSDPEKSRQEMNRFIKEATNGKIKEAFIPGAITVCDKLILANAIYFMGKWKNKFSNSATVKNPFYTINKEVVMVDMMFQTQSYKYLSSEDLKAEIIEIPYLGETFNLIILLPFERYDLPLLEKNISMQKVNHEIKQMCWKQLVTLGLPKIKLEEDILLNEHLQNLGMTEAFTTSANFCGISSKENLYISSALHKSFLDVDEEGTEAAVVTKLRAMRFSSCPIPQFHFTVDHPFMMLIRESTTGLILFLGSIHNLWTL